MLAIGVHIASCDCEHFGLSRAEALLVLKPDVIHSCPKRDLVRALGFVIKAVHLGSLFAVLMRLAAAFVRFAIDAQPRHQQKQAVIADSDRFTQRHGRLFFFGIFFFRETHDASSTLARFPFTNIARGEEHPSCPAQVMLFEPTSIETAQFCPPTPTHRFSGFLHRESSHWFNLPCCKWQYKVCAR